MTIAEMLEQSGVLTLLGMGIVFGFLVVMIICMTLLGKAIHALGWDRDVQAKGAPAPIPVPVTGTPNNAAITAAISAAVIEYRRIHKE
ncbi:MAG: OadG family protein [Treponema sp.]|jgi:oxaloacetate decarboxylase gamma subunit|nr:OadG family protein [Treponema sp.]